MDGPPEILVPISERTAYLSRVHVGVTIPLLALCLVAFFARFYIRIRPTWRLGWDDWFVAAGFASAIADWALLQSEIIMVPQMLSFPVATNAMMLAYLAIPVWGLAMTCIKISAALTLLRIPQNKLWKIFLYFITALQISYFIGDTVFIFIACRPLRALWDLSVTGASCLGPKAAGIASNVGTGVNITTDVSLSLAPMFILWRLRRPLRERILICILTGIGLFASMTSIVKAVIVRGWGDPELDAWQLAVSIATWTILEQFLAVLAVCSPSLKQPLQRLLASMGILLAGYNSRISFIQLQPSVAKTEPGDENDGGTRRPRLPPPVYGGKARGDKPEFSTSTTGDRSDLSADGGKMEWPYSQCRTQGGGANPDAVGGDIV